MAEDAGVGEQERCLHLYRKLTGGVSLVTVAGEGGPRGMTASTVTSVSLSPPLLAVFLDSRSGTLAELRHRGVFGISLLTAGQRDLARAFAVPGGPRFAGVTPRQVRGVPLPPDALAWSVCAVTDCRPYGDHHVVVGRVLEAAVAEGAPLVWHDAGFAQLAAA